MELSIKTMNGLVLVLEFPGGSADQLYRMVWVALPAEMRHRRMMWQMMLLNTQGQWLRPTVTALVVPSLDREWFLWIEPHHYRALAEEVKVIDSEVGDLIVYDITIERDDEVFHVERLSFYYDGRCFFFDGELGYDEEQELYTIQCDEHTDWMDMLERVEVSLCARERLRELLRGLLDFWELLSRATPCDCPIYLQEEMTWVDGDAAAPVDAE